jgi:hypothetical protein
MRIAVSGSFSIHAGFRIRRERAACSNKVSLSEFSQQLSRRPPGRRFPSISVLRRLPYASRPRHHHHRDLLSSGWAVSGHPRASTIAGSPVTTYGRPTPAHIGPALATNMDPTGGTIAKAPGAGKTMITAMATVTLTDMTRIATTATMGIIMRISPHECRAPNGLPNRKNAKSLRD